MLMMKFLFKIVEFILFIDFEKANILSIVN